MRPTFRTRGFLLCMLLSPTASIASSGGGATTYLGFAALFGSVFGFGMSLLTLQKSWSALKGYVVTLASGLAIMTVIGSLIEHSLSWENLLRVAIAALICTPVQLTIFFAIGYGTNRQRHAYAASQRIRRKAELQKLAAGLSEEDLVLLGTCPNCEKVVRLSCDECQTCKASFAEGSAWKVLPLLSELSVRNPTLGERFESKLKN